MTYEYLTHGKTKAQRADIDRALLGPEGETPEAIGAANKAAMDALGMIGAVPTRKRSK